MNIVEACHDGAVRPANLKVGSAVECVVHRTREVVVGIEQLLYRDAVFVDIGLHAGPDNGEWGIAHHRLSFEWPTLRLKAAPASSLGAPDAQRNDATCRFS